MKNDFPYVYKIYWHADVDMIGVNQMIDNCVLWIRDILI